VWAHFITGFVKLVTHYAMLLGIVNYSFRAVKKSNERYEMRESDEDE
jgi:hypothetical protein